MMGWWTGGSGSIFPHPPVPFPHQVDRRTLGKDNFHRGGTLELRTNGTDDPTFPPGIHLKWKKRGPLYSNMTRDLVETILVEKYAACGSPWKTGGKLVELNSTNPKCLLEITSITLENIQIHKHTFIMI